jgi:L-seryl-tRNA(Ser) seleniumtransferase
MNMTDARSRLRAIPSVDQLMQAKMAEELAAIYGRPLTLESVRTAVEAVRQKIIAETEDRQPDGAPEPETILRLAADQIDEWLRPSLLPLINATGVVLHTNLGRASLSRAAAGAVQSVSLAYSNLEYDLQRGARGSRLVHAEALLTRLTGAEAALVVNNNAGALLLVLSALARRKRVIISRGQLVEIGGGFRIPDVMNQSGARLVEIGTTNRVHLADYEEALQEPAGLLLRAHQSNFRIIGFTTEPQLAEIGDLAHQYNVPLVDDLGSGVLLDTARFGLAHEPTVQESLAAGADIVCFSGDKLLGGPQAGIILGKASLLAKIKKHPLARALRADKLCLAALAATLLHYLKDEAEREIPIWRMIASTPDSIRARAESWAKAISSGTVIAGQSTVGGGSLPEEVLPTYLLALPVPQPNRFLARLRQQSPPIIARVQDDLVVLDPRTVLPEEEETLLSGLRSVLNV